MPLFCRHNRLTAECPICSVRQEPAVGARSAAGRRPARKPQGQDRRGPPPFQGPFAAAGPYTDEQGRYEVRLERVPGGLRLAAWQAGAIRRQAPVVAVADLLGLVDDGRQSGALDDDEAAALLRAVDAGTRAGRSAGRAGDLREELRIEPLGDGRVRIARWLLRPGSGWELQQAPVMLPASRYVEALASGSAEPQRP